jgi:large-conductance mechanosensitive channel
MISLEQSKERRSGPRIPPQPPKEEQLVAEIRDLLRQK